MSIIQLAFRFSCYICLITVFVIALFSPFVKRENEQIIAPFSTLMYNELRIDNER